MVHDEFHIFRMCIFIQHFNIKIWIWCNKIKNKFFRFSEPIFPTFVPTFYQNSIKAMFRSEIDIFFNIVIVRSVRTVWFRFRIICNAKMYIIDIGIIPSSTIWNEHLPPNSNIFHWMNP